MTKTKEIIKKTLSESRSNWLSKIPKLPQSQDSVTEQLHDLHKVANRVGLYDAADWLKNKARLAV